jgi:general nucleoside transport system permease protein
VAVIPVAILFGGFGAAGSLLQRRLGLPDASVLLLQGIAFVLILASGALRDTDWKALFLRLSRFGPSEPSPIVIPGLTPLPGMTDQARNDKP